MYNFDDIIKIYFKDTTAREVFDQRVSYDNYPEEIFRKKALISMKHYSDTEYEGLYDYTKEYLSTGINKINVFRALEKLADKLLIMENDQVVCKYSALFRWRDVTTAIGEDKLICAFLAKRCLSGLEYHREFLWGVAIGHNNMQLNRMLQEGLAENHFHLFGSAPAFELIWIKLMNHITVNYMNSELKKIDSNRRSGFTSNDINEKKDSLTTQHLQAALIRVVLVLFLLKKQGKVKEKSGEKGLLGKYGYNLEVLSYILRSPEMLENERSNIQKLISDLKNRLWLKNSMVQQDYALEGVEIGCNNQQNQGNLIFSGDRWMLYELLIQEYRGKKTFDPEIYNWLYAYLLIKSDMRSEILQINENIGFENFSIYNKRKNGFLYKENEKEQMVKKAIYSCMQTGNIQRLELRINPSNSVYENGKMIYEIDKMIEEEMGEANSRSNWFYYVFHFPKAKDILMERYTYYGKSYRHYRFRKKIDRQAKILIEFRNKYPKLASRVKGIDACSQEIGCRPEVFGPVFRKLGQHICKRNYKYEARQLRKTYHVGEDFLDIVDGLRAIEESILFLNLQCGDRIGHGTVLGIDVEKWYQRKRNTIIISKQDYLDNIAWLYHKIIEFQMSDHDGVKDFLSKEFDRYFSEIYEKNIDIKQLNYPYGMKGAFKRGQTHHFNIHNYYDAWKLRGDDPSLYCNGTYDFEKNMWVPESMINKAEDEYKQIRENPECTILYYYYHYCWDVRYCGEMKQEIYIPVYYKKCVQEVQKEMQKRVGKLGIGIETNPTSNLLISSIMDYKEHPILKMYNKDLLEYCEEAKNCPQLFVSINTDDKGVFRTTLENEFSYLACSLEREKNEEGKDRYNRQMIYQWLDNIRVMGLRQSFLDRE